MPMTDAEIRQQLAALWSSNLFNVRRAATEARAQGRTHIDIGFELVDTTFNAQGEFMPYAKECLVFLASRPVFSLFLWTIADAETSTRLNITKLVPLHITIKGHNDNPTRRNVAWDPRKPWFDVIIDRTLGFDAEGGHWYWMLGLFRTAAEVINDGLSGTRVIQKAPAYEIPPTGLIRRRLS